MPKKINEKEIKNVRLWDLMQHSLKAKNARDLAKEIYFMLDWAGAEGNPKAGCWTEEYKLYSRNIEKLQKKIIAEIYDPSKMKAERILAYCKYFNVPADYLLGLSEYKSYGGDFISKSTGLCDDSIKALQTWHNAKNGLIKSSDLQTLNEILSNIRNKQKKRGYSNIQSIFHHIGLFIHSDSVKKSPANKVHYQYGNKFSDLQIGDTINGNVISSVSILDDNTFSDINKHNTVIVNDASTNQPYEIPVDGLVGSFAMLSIIDDLKELKTQHEKETQFSD